jgi:hypothetical protein
MLVPAVLLAAATVAADVVITAEEVIPCSVVTCDTSFTRLTLPTGGSRMLNTRDALEIRLSDSSRVAELSTRLPQLRVVLDSGQPVPAPAIRTGEMPAPQGSLIRGPAGHTVILDTLQPATTPQGKWGRYPFSPS